MACVVCEPCYGCKYTDCVAVCPVECFWADEKMLYVCPDTCIDCEACIDACPPAAIYPDADVPAQWTQYVELNARRVRELKEGGEANNLRDPIAPLEGPGCGRK
jgi:ferredoxin